MHIPAMLLATHKALVLWENGRQIVLHSGLGVYYGITWSERRLYVVARANEPSRTLAFDGNMWPLDPPPFQHLGVPEDGPHQALWWDDVLYVTNTQHNRVEQWHEGSNTVVHRGWENAGVAEDVDHVNSIWRDPESGDFWIAEHRKQLRPKRIRVVDWKWEDRASLELDLSCLTDGPVHTGLHNVYVEDGTLYTLGPSQLVIWPLDGEPAIYKPDGVVKYKHYLRGFARNRDGFFIGVSNASPADRRGWGASKVLVLDDRLDLVDSIVLDPRFGQLMEIRLLQGDVAHNGLDCPLGIESGARQGRVAGA